ncbi:MAG: hypothetical protein RLZ28_215 [Actinomycetota bacterium]|jgi:hypothetical protein
MVDLALLALIALASVAIGSRVITKHFWLTVPIGFLAVVVLRILSVVIATAANRLPVKIDGLDAWVFVALLVAFALPGVKNLRSQLWALSASFGVVALGELGSRVLGFFTRPHGDALWILTLAEYVSGGGAPWVMGTSMSLKRGFSLILLLGLGEGENRIDAFMPIIFGLLAMVTIGFTLLLLRDFSRRVTIASIAVVAAVVFTASMPWVAVFYVNGHTLVALGITVSVAAMLVSHEVFAHPRGQLIAVCLGLAVVTMTRPEGALLSLVVVAIFASRHDTKPTEVLVSIAAVFASFLTWMYTVSSYVLTGRMTWLVPLAMVIVLAAVWALYRWVPKVIDRIFALTPVILFAVFAGLEVVFFSALKKGDRSLVTNLLLGSGGWGFIFWGFLIIAAVSFFVKREMIYGTLLRVLVSLSLASFLAKMVDGGQFGSPTLGRVGWDDSLNRMWIHFMGLFVVAAIVGVAQILTNDFVGLKLRRSIGASESVDSK